MIIDTKRLVLKHADESEAYFFLELLNSPGWLSHIGDREVRSVSQVEGYIKNVLQKSYAEHGFGLFTVVLKETRQPIGICGFVIRDYLPSADIGFAILPQYEGNGYITEACEAVVKYGVAELGMKEVYGIVSESNMASQHLLTKLGLCHVSNRTDGHGTVLKIYHRSLAPGSKT